MIETEVSRPSGGWSGGGRGGWTAALSTPTPAVVVVALVLGVLGALVGLVYQRSRPAVYQSSAVVLFDNPGAIASNGGAVTAVSQVRGKYAGLLATDAIAAPVASRVGVPLGAVEAGVRAIVSPLDLDLVVVAGSGRPADAQRIADATAEEVVTYVQHEQESLPSSIPAGFRLRATVVRPARGASRVSPTRKAEEVTGAVTGVLVAVVAYVALQAGTDELRRSRRQRRRLGASASGDPVPGGPVSGGRGSEPVAR